MLAKRAGIEPGEIVALCCLRDRDPRTFERESRILRELNHPYILRYRHSFIERDTVGHLGDLCCLVTEFLDGETLRSVIESTNEGHGLPWNQVKQWVLQILEALEYASSREVVHRDLKPANIFITRDATAKLIDFGIARRRQDSEYTASVVGVKGSWDYMAPDFARPPTPDFRGDERSDIYSFGVLLYQLLTGQLPFESLAVEGAPFVFQKRWSDLSVAPRPRFRHPAFRVFPRLRGILEECLQPDWAKRRSSFGTLRRELRDIGPLVLSGSKSGESYECTEFLGDGGFGQVFLATWTRDGQEVGRVAVKQLKASATSNLRATAIERFEREANLLKTLHHPNLVRSIDFKRIDDLGGGRYFLILEYLPGMPEAGLRSRITRSKDGLEPAHVLDLFTRYLDALDYLHQQGIIHRDIKPHNLYAPEGEETEAKIFDLGIALDQEASDKTTGPIPGSWDYMPPEFATPGSARGTPASDLYSLGITLYQALTGSLPFPEIRSLEEYLQRSETPPPIPFSHPVFKDYPKLSGILGTLLAVLPADRYQDAKQLSDDLRRCLEGDSSHEATTDAGGSESFRPAMERAIEEVLNGNYPDAIERCQSIINSCRQAPEAVEWREVALALEAADQARSAGAAEIAEELLASIRQRFPENRALLPGAAQLLSGMEVARGKEDWSTLERLLRHASQVRPAPDSNTRQSMVHIGLIAAEQALGGGNYSAARAICGALLPIAPGHPQAAPMLGLCQVLMDASAAAGISDWPRAVRLLRNGSIEHPDSPQLCALLARSESEVAKQDDDLGRRLGEGAAAFCELRLVEAGDAARAMLGLRPDFAPAQALLSATEACISAESADVASAATVLREIRGRYSDEALGALGLPEIGKVLEEKLRDLRSVKARPSRTGISETPMGDGETRGVSRRRRLLREKPLLMAGITVLVVVTVAVTLRFQQHRYRTKLMATLKSELGKVGESYGDRDLTGISTRSQNLEDLDRDLRQWWPKYFVTNAVEVRSAASSEFSNLLTEGLQAEPMKPTYRGPDAAMVERVRERVRAKQSAAEGFVRLGGAWNQYMAEAGVRADLSDPDREPRSVVAEMAKDRDRESGLAGFEQAFRRATNAVLLMGRGSAGNTIDIADERARRIRESREAKDDRIIGISGGRPADALSPASAPLDQVFDAFRVWYGLQVNDGTMRNPPGYQPRQGELAEKLVNTPRSRDLPSEKDILDLQSKFEDAGKMNQETRDDFSRLVREVRNRNRR
jgi:serine/threonine protein kinase